MTKEQDLITELKEREKQRDELLNQCIKKNEKTGKYKPVVTETQNTLGLIYTAEIFWIKKGIEALEETKAQTLAEIKELKEQRDNLIGDNLALKLKISKLQEQKDDGGME